MREQQYLGARTSLVMKEKEVGLKVSAKKNIILKFFLNLKITVF